MKERKDVGRLLKNISIKFKRIIDSNLNDNITDIQMFILGFIYKNQGKKDIIQKDIENVLEVRRSTVTEVLNTMEKNQLIYRIESGEDKRKKVIVLSDKGICFLNEFREIIEKLEDNLLKDIDNNDLEIFFKVAEKMKDNLKEMEEIC